mmetsp:Transcript_118465/g.281240  ORF Transcript_118465/g.281240 Transcript_118465/m.281240 type:complete len:230 (-) Transcript_118465:9-698(-)
MPARVTLEEPLVRFALVDAADARRLRRLRSRSLHRARHPVFLALPNPAIHRSPLAEEVQEAVPVQLEEGDLHLEVFPVRLGIQELEEAGDGTRHEASILEAPGSPGHGEGLPVAAASQGHEAAALQPLHGVLDGGLGDFLEDPRLARTRTARAEDPVEGEVPQHVLRLLPAWPLLTYAGQLHLDGGLAEADVWTLLRLRVDDAEAAGLRFAKHSPGAKGKFRLGKVPWL